MYDEIFMIDLLADFHFLLTLIFGVILSAAFIGMERTKDNWVKLVCFLAVSASFQFLTFKYWGAERALQLYPLFIHLPLVIFLSYAYKVSFYCSFLAVSTAYLCCQLTKWLGIVAAFFFPLQLVYYTVRIAVTLPLLLLLLRYVAPRFTLLARLPFRELATLCLMPFVYYIYDYVTTVYTKLLYSGNALVAEFLGFFLCVVYIIFLVIFAQEYITNKELEARNKLIELKISSTIHELNQMRYAQYQMSIMRHDMRHFLSTARTLVQQGKYAEAVKYLNNEQSELESVILQRYCSNEYVNAIIAKYSEKCRLKKIRFSANVAIAEILPCPELNFSTILDNALENAYEAAHKLPADRAMLDLSLKQKENKLLMSVKNTYAQKPEFKDGVPVSHNPGHGIGSQSIVYNCEKIGGQCRFSLEEEYFVLRVII